MCIPGGCAVHFVRRSLPTAPELAADVFPFFPELLALELLAVSELAVGAFASGPAVVLIVAGALVVRTHPRRLYWQHQLFFSTVQSACQVSNPSEQLWEQPKFSFSQHHDFLSLDQPRSHLSAPSLQSNRQPL